MSDDTTTLSAYVDEEFAEEVRSYAEREGVSISSFIVETLERRIQREAFEKVSSETQAERRIEELVAEARDTLVETTSEHRHAQTEASRYAIALWELLKEDYPELDRKAALETASERLDDSGQRSRSDLSGGSTVRGGDLSGGSESESNESPNTGEWDY